MKNKPTKPRAAKPRSGRPPLGDDAHNLTLTLRVSRNELEAWKAMAAKKGMTVRDYILSPHRKALRKLIGDKS